MVWRKLVKSFGISLEVFHLVRLRPLDLLQEGIRRSDKKAIVHEFPKENGTPGRIRTCDPRLRRTVRYPPELRAEMALARTTTTNFRI